MEPITVKAKDGADITALALGFVESPPKAIVLISHGFGEHAGSYVELAGKLHDAGFASITHSQRGHGLPPFGAKKNFHGTIPGYQSFIDDMVTLTDYVQEKFPDTPIALYGHSMGGNIVTNTLLRVSKEQVASYSCAVLESPWFGLYVKRGPFLLGLLRFLENFSPNMRIVQKLEQNNLSSDAGRVEGYANDPLYHGFLSVRMINGIFKACDLALEKAADLPTPTFLAYASDELVVCNDEIKEFIKKAGDKVTSKEYKSRHAIHNDSSREQFFTDVIAFINSNT